MDTDGKEQEGEEGKVYDGVDEDGGGAGLHSSKLNESSGPPWNLKHQAWRQQYKQHQPYHHRPQISSHSLSISPSLYVW